FRSVVVTNFLRVTFDLLRDLSMNSKLYDPAIWSRVTGHVVPTFGIDGVTNIFRPLAQPAQEIKETSFLVLAICAVIFLIVAGLLVYAIVRFRHRAGDEASEPPQVYGSNQ